MKEGLRYSKYEPIFGAWYIKEEIGKGAVGRVFRIERESFGKIYEAALKAITIPDSPDDVKRALSSGVNKDDLPDYYRGIVGNVANEFKYMADLKGCSYIVNYEDHLIIEDEDEFKWDVLIKTELLTPLVEYAIEDPLTPADVVELGIDICRALEFCAQFNIIHRDIKPENIFVGPEGTYKLGDFGIARVAEETQSNLSRKGTYAYMAPEVFHGDAYGPSVDLYSLGIVMYKYLNHGRLPFMPQFPEKVQYGDIEKAFAMRMSGRSIPEPDESTERLTRIVLKACKYAPEERYGSAAEMLADLEALRVRMNKGRSQSKHGSGANVGGLKRKPDSADKQVKKTARKRRNSASREIGNYNALSFSRERERRIRRRAIAAVGAVLVAVAAAVGVYFAIPKEVTGITGIDSNISLYYDESVQPEYAIEPDWFRDETISFISTDADVFTVNKEGRIEAASIGEAELIMHAKEYTKTVHVSVKPKVTGITGIEQTYELTTGDSLTLEPSLEPTEFADEKITYKSKDADVVSVDKSGKLTALKAGSANVIVKAGGASFTTHITATDPVVYHSTGNSTKSKKKKSTKSTNKKSDGYFDSGDDEYFGG